MRALSNATGQQAAQLRASLRRLAAMPVVLALLLFVPAGSLTWLRGWLFFADFIVLIGAAAAFLWRANPEIYAARSRIQPGTKRWDRILLGILMPLIFALPPLAALDAGRFHWSHMSWWVVGLGHVLLIAGMALTVWAQAVNRFFEPGVRVQTERGHHVIDTGPYAVIRHPGYFAACLLLPGIALALGSWWALVLAGLGAALLVVRIVYEERTLRAELPGYGEYAHRVRFRLVPGVW